ncbi:MAG: hypothetical protein HY903_05745 [Deltaproteobacteria bacterium]|nr:hypothetical protein [Deltaproteobacteria bacterium]
MTRSRLVIVMALATTARGVAAAELPADDSGAQLEAAAEDQVVSEVEAPPEPAASAPRTATGEPAQRPRPRAAAGIKGRAGPIRLGLQGRLQVTGGAFRGQGVRRADGALTELAVDGVPTARFSKLRLSLPFSARHRQTFGAALVESRATIDGELRFKPDRSLALTVGAGVGGVRRPDWPDLYQPQQDGGLAPTDRYSYWRRKVRGGIDANPASGLWLHADYLYALVVYRQDPTFDPFVAPNHLVPADHGEHAATLSATWRTGGLKLGVSAAAFQRRYFFTFARDRGTGLTHANAGGLPGNPLQTLRGVEPGLSAEVALQSLGAVVRGGYGFEIVDDIFAGYYSFTGHHPWLALRLRPHARLEVGVGGSLHWRRYGPESYAEGPGHPALRGGERRFDHRASAFVGPRLQLSDACSLSATLRYAGRRTSFPPYEPGVFPAARQYDVRWSFDNWRATLTLAYVL